EGVPPILARRSDAGTRRPREAVLRAAAQGARGPEGEPSGAGRAVEGCGGEARMTWRTLLRTLPRDLRESIAGDLEEEYRRRADRSRWRARGWIWLQAARLAVIFRWERTAHGRALPPIGDEIRTARWLDAVRTDVAFGLRMLIRQPGFATVAILV